MSVKSKMTAIADKIRALLGISGTMGLDAMATNLTTAQNEVSVQEDLITQIAAALEGKAVEGGGSSQSSIFTATARVTSNNQQISFTGLTAQPKAFAVIPTGNITLSTSNRFVVNVNYDGTTLGGVYCYGSGGWNATYTAGYSASYFTQTYSGGTLTIKTSSTTNGGYFAANVDYALIAIY